MADLHHAMRSKPTQANRTLALLSKMFNLAEPILRRLAGDLERQLVLGEQVPRQALERHQVRRNRLTAFTSSRLLG